MSATIRHTIPLPGCTPEPLMNYLKALGILRIDQRNKESSELPRASWKNGVFALTCHLDEQSHPAFFPNEYAPSPIMGPWNGEVQDFLPRRDV